MAKEEPVVYAVSQLNSDHATDRANVVLIDGDGGSLSVYVKASADTTKAGVKKRALEALEAARKCLEEA